MAHIGPKQKPQRTRNSFLREERERKTAEAKVRQDLAAARSPAEQVARLDARLGVGVGAVKERERLWNRMKAAASPTTGPEATKAAVKAAQAAQAPQEKAQKARKARKGAHPQQKGS